MTEDELIRLRDLLDRVHVGVSQVIEHVRPSQAVIDLVAQVGRDLGAACAMVYRSTPPKKDGN